MLYRKILWIAVLFTAIFSTVNGQIQKGNVVFIHPDGTGLSTWNATRLLNYGPDGELNWDKMPNIGLYKSHMKNSLSASSHAGATHHAYGVDVIKDSYGMNGKEELTALSGKKMSIMQEAIKAGIKTGIVNSGNIIEPGTGVFVASSTSRGNSEEITKKIIQSRADVIMSGGEEWLLPEGVEGFHVENGRRTDGLNLIKYAESNGYTVVYNKKQLNNLSNDVDKVLGVFAADHTFNDKSEEYNKENNLPSFNEEAPTLQEMTHKAIEILSNNDEQFFLVVEEEATDNFANYNNAKGTLEALKRADDAIGTVLDYIKEDPKTLLLTAADSEAGGFEIYGAPIEKMDPNENIKERDSNGAPWDGQNGTGTKPFLAKADKYGQRLPFIVSWSTYSDTYGSVVAKAAGLNSELMKGLIDNTDIYRYMYATLFGKLLK